MPADDQTVQWNVAAALAAWLVPGLGHILLGERRRGIILLVSLSLMWLSGLLIGGVTVIDYKNHTAWFLGQALLAPSVGVNIITQRLRASDPNPLPDEPHKYAPAFGRPDEQGVLFTALAGLLNLMAILDVIHYDPSRRQQQSESSPAPPGGKPRASTNASGGAP